MVSQVNYSVRVTVFVIIPRNEFDEFWRHLNTRIVIECRTEWVSHEVNRNEFVVSPSHVTFHFTFRSFFNFLRNFIISSSFSKSNSQVNNRYVNSWDSESHTGKFTVEFWDNKSNGFSSTGGTWDDAFSESSSKSPTFGWSINSSLSSSNSVDSGHETFNNTPVVMNNLG